MNRDYKKDYSHPAWRSKREHIFLKFGKRCAHSGCDSSKWLEVHHKKYLPDRRAWEYPDENFLVLCHKHHTEQHGIPYEERQCRNCGTHIPSYFELCWDCKTLDDKKQKHEIEKLKKEIARLETEKARPPTRGLVAPEETLEREILVLKKEIDRLETEKTRPPTGGLPPLVETHSSPSSKSSGFLWKAAVALIGILALVESQKKTASVGRPNYRASQVRPNYRASPPTASPSTGSPPRAARTDSRDFRRFLGQSVEFNAQIVAVRYAKNGNAYLDIGGRFPNATLTLVVFKNGIPLFGDLRGYAGCNVHFFGKVSEYQGAIQVILNDKSQIRLAD